MNQNFRLTFHATERITKRLAGVVTLAEVQSKLSGRKLPWGRSYVEIKKIRYTEIQDPSVKPDGIARGDQLVAVIDNDNSPRVTTIVLRKSWSKSETYRNILH